MLQQIITCGYSGLPIGSLQLVTEAGAIPYLARWHESIIYHPVFGLPPGRLFDFARDTWNELARTEDDVPPTKTQRELVQVSFLAILHTLGCIDQREPALPSYEIASTQMHRLLRLAAWKWKLESLRFSFPAYRIGKWNANNRLENISDYLDTCIEARKAYLAGIDQIAEESKARAADEAAKMLANEWLRPVTPKAMLRWIAANVSDKYRVDCENWLGHLFTGGPLVIISYEEEDLELMEEIILAECPIGTGMMKHVRERIKTIQQTWADHHKAFEILLEDHHEGDVSDPGPEPVSSDFASKGLWLQAKAKWQIARSAWQKKGGK